MPDPTKLRVGDRVRFVSLPEEWLDPTCSVDEESVEFMKIMIRRGWASRVREIDEWGVPWIEARIRIKGRLVYHHWCVCETTGWRLTRRRALE